MERHYTDTHTAWKYLFSVIFFLSSIILLMPASARSQELLYYSGRDYGSESQYNPLTLMLNAGYDIYQTRRDHDIFGFTYEQSANNVFRNLSHPFKAISRYGWGDFMVEEVFPLTVSMDRARWYPNYQLHLIGGGVTYSYLTDYFTLHEYSFPRVWAGITYMSYHLMNEIIENDDYQGYSVDAVSDIYIFDIGGMILFSSPAVRRFFKTTVIMSDWSMQPAIVFPEGYLENNGQYFSMKWRFPFRKNRSWHFFYYYGLNFVVGLSYLHGNGYSLSVGGGVRTKSITVEDTSTNKQSILYVYTGGIFIDRYNSLLASLIVNYNYYQVFQLNVYPGVLRYGDYTAGLFLALSQDYRVLAGATFRCIPGIGYKDRGFYSEVR